MKGRKCNSKIVPIICEDIMFLSVKEAAKHFSINVTTVYNRLADVRYSNWYKIIKELK